MYVTFECPYCGDKIRYRVTSGDENNKTIVKQCLCCESQVLAQLVVSIGVTNVRLMEENRLTVEEKNIIIEGVRSILDLTDPEDVLVFEEIKRKIEQ